MRSAFFPAEQQQQQHGSHQLQAPLRAALSPHKAANVTHTGYQSRPAAGSIGQNGRANSTSRGLRFPSSRRYLWDRTAAGPQVLIELLDYLPHVQVAASTFGAIARAASSRAERLTLQLNVSVSNNNQLTALIQEHDPLAGAQPAVQLSCAVTQPGATAADWPDSLREALLAHLDQRGNTSIEQLFALAATATTATSPAEPTSLRLQLMMPRIGLLATPLYTKRLCHVPLAEALLKPGGMAAGQTGYLSMDQARSLLPLEATDTEVYSTPLVGVWVKGPSGVLHPLVAAACVRFAFSSLLLDRAANPDDSSFLLLLCPEGDPVSKCYEVRMTDSSQLELCCYRLEAGVRAAAGLSQYPGGVISGTWVPEQRHVQPIAGTLTAAAGCQALPAGLGTLGRPTAGSIAQGSRGYQPSSTGLAGAAANSPVLHPHSHSSRSAQLPLSRSSAPSAPHDFSFQEGGVGVAAAAAARRSLPLAYDGSLAADSSHMWPGAACVSNGSARAPMHLHMQPVGAEEPQPRSTMPAVPYTSPAQVSTHRQQVRQPAMQERPGSAASAADAARAAAAAAAFADTADMGLSSTCSSPTKVLRQLAWSDRQDQVLRNSLEAAAEALRSSQASLAAARDAASGAGSRLSSPTKAQAHAATAAAAHWAAEAQPELSSHPGAPAAVEGAAMEHDVQGAAAPGSPQPGLSRLGNPPQQQQQQQQHGDSGAESDSGPCMGSPVRPSMQKKASLLAAAAAHAAGMPGTAAAAGGAGQRPVSPSVQAGVALSNLSLLQHLSSGQLQQAVEQGSSPQSSLQQLQQQAAGDNVLQAIGSEAVAAVTCSSVPAVPQSCVSELASSTAMLYSHNAQPVQPLAFAAGAAAMQACSAPLQHTHSTSTTAALLEPCNASRAAAAALRAASSSMQQAAAHPYGHSLGAQRYAADVAVMRSSTQGSPGRLGLLSPGSFPGMVDAMAAPWRQQQGLLQPCQQQQLLLPGRLPHAWSPGPSSTLDPSSSRGSPYWLQQQQQQQQQGLQVSQQASPMSAGLSPGWAADPVAQALQSEVDRLRQQLYQLQHQLRLAGMSLQGPEVDASCTGPPPAAAAAGQLMDAGQSLPASEGTLQLAGPQVLGQQPPMHCRHQPQPGGATHLAAAAAGGVAGVAEGAVAGLTAQVQPCLQLAGSHQWVGPSAQHMQGIGWASQPLAPHPAAAAAGCDRPAPAAQPGAQQEQSGGGHAATTSAVHVSCGNGTYMHVNARYAAAEASPAANAYSSAGLSADALALAASQPAAAATAAAAAAGVVDGEELAAVQQRHQPEGQNRHAVRPPAATQAVQGQPVEPMQQQQQQDSSAASESARHRRRKLDFGAGEAAAGHAGSSDSHSSSSDTDHIEGRSTTARASAAADEASTGPAKQAAERGKAVAPLRQPLGMPTSSAAVDPKASCAPLPTSCSSPAVQAPAGNAGASASNPTSAAAKGPAAVLLTAAADAHDNSAAMDYSSGMARGAAAAAAGSAMRYSVRSSGGGGMGHVRVSLDAPPLVEVVRARVVDLSDDSDEDDWEDRLLVKYGLK